VADSFSKTIIELVEEDEGSRFLDTFNVAETKLTKAVVANSENATIGAEHDNVAIGNSKMSDLPGLADRFNNNRSIRMDKVLPLTSTIDVVRLGSIESYALTGKYSDNLAVKDAPVDLLPANDGFMIAETKFAEAVLTEDKDLIRASKTTNENSEVIVTDGNIEDTSIETEDGGNVSSDSLSDVLGVTNDEANVVTTSEVGVGNLGIKRILVLRAGIVGIQ
jgi:hypothetical protein